MIPQPVARAAAARLLDHRMIESGTGVEFVLHQRSPRASAMVQCRTPKNIRWKQIREQLSEAQNHRCCYCGKRCDDDATIDHVVARCHGGTDAQSNLVMACKGCNELRGCRDAYDFFDSEEWTSSQFARVGRQASSLGSLWPVAVVV